MKIDWQDSTTVTWIILGIIVIVAVLYSIFALKNKPPVVSFTPGINYTFPYQLQKPNWRIELPQELKEISGIHALPDDQVLAIQDEKGIIFTLDIRQGTIIKRRTFDKDRDYEDLCVAGEDLFILERDGDLYRTTFVPSQDTIQKYETAFSYRNDTESLGFDEAHNRLLIAPKDGAPEGSELPKQLQGIYAFDLTTKRVLLDPVCTISQKEVGQIIDQGGKAYRFKPSALAIHPTTKNLYVLSSVGKCLIVLDSQCEILHIDLLDSELFPQPEGLAFDQDENLLISSEGVGQAASITRYAPASE